MGEAKRKRTNGQAGSSRTRPTPNKVRIVQHLRLQNSDAERVIILMLGQDEPELCTALTPEKARELAAGLITHAQALDTATRRILLPGEAVAPGGPFHV